MDVSNSPRKGIRFTKVTLICMIGFLLSIILLIVTITPHSPRYYFYGRMNAELRDSELFEDMRNGDSFCFVGDSITDGSLTGGVSWHHHLDKYIKVDVLDFSYTGWTTRTLVENKDLIPSADIYVIAIGINDVLYSDVGRGATSSAEFVDNLSIVTERIREISPDAKFYFVAPWVFRNFPDETFARGDEYSGALKDWCEADDYIYVDPDPIILSVIDKDGWERYMLDDIHPNAERGVGLYSYAVLEAEHRRTAGT